MKRFVLFCLLILAANTYALPVGFNQAWFKNNYASQYLDQVYDEAEVTRIFKLTHEAGATNLRLWLFESASFPMLLWKENHLVGIRPDFIKNFLRTLQIAKEHDVQVYMTFFDAHVYRPDKLDRSALKKIRNFYGTKGGDEFLAKVIGPLLQAIEDAGLSSSVSRIDLSNEVDAVINRGGFDQRWAGAGRMLCRWRAYIQKFNSFSKTPVTFSLRLHALVLHPHNLLSDQGPMACADYFDFHSYEDSGKIHRCKQMQQYAGLKKKPLILGEFGQGFFNHRYDNDLQMRNTATYLASAKNCGFSEALAWRLSDNRPGFNKEARYSFEAFGIMRPAYELIKTHNETLLLNKLK